VTRLYGITFMAPRQPHNRSRRAPAAGRWRLQDAKARLSEVVRKAQSQGPQRVTLHGRDTVVIVSADEFDRLRTPVAGRHLVDALRASPLTEVVIERTSIKSRVRDTGL
jgi:prevent-host-death family protein